MILPPFFGFPIPSKDSEIYRLYHSYISQDLLAYNPPTKTAQITYLSSDILTYIQQREILFYTYLSTDILSYSHASTLLQYSYLSCDLLSYDPPPEPTTTTTTTTAEPTTTTTTTAAPGGVTGFILAEGASPSSTAPPSYGTYCEDGTYNGKPKYRKTGTNYYIYIVDDFGSLFWDVSDSLGSYYGNGYYAGNDFNSITTPNPASFPPSYSVTQTACGGTTTTTTTSAPSTPAYLVSGASDSSYNGTYALAGTTVYGGVISNYYRITGQSRYLYWSQAFGYHVWMISDTLGSDFYGEFNGYTSGGESDSVPAGDSGFWGSYGSVTGVGPNLTATMT